MMFLLLLVLFIVLEKFRKLYKQGRMNRIMKMNVEHMHLDIETIKQDLAVIKHILSEEGILTESAKKRLDKARAIPISEYKEL